MVLANRERQGVLDQYQVDVTIFPNKPHIASNSEFDADLLAVRRAQPAVHLGVVATRDTENTAMSLALAVASREIDDVVTNFVRTVELAGKQLSGGRPSVVAVHLPEDSRAEPPPRKESPFVQAFGVAAVRGRLSRVSLALLTTEGNSVEDGIIKFGGQLFGLKNNFAVVPIPNEFPGTYSAI